MDDSTSRLGGNQEEHNQLARNLDTLSENPWHYRLLAIHCLYCKVARNKEAIKDEMFPVLEGEVAGGLSF